MGTTQTVIFGAAIAVWVLAVTLAGWRHKLFLAGLFAASFALLLLGFFWPQVRTSAPKIGAAVDSAAASNIVWLGLLLACLVAASHAQYQMRKKALTDDSSTTRSQEETPLEEIRGLTFRNEKVVLDGRRYVNCQFHNVTFQYGGGPSALSHNMINGCMIEPVTQELMDYTHLLFQFGYLRSGIEGPDGPLQNLNRFDGEADR